VRKFLFLSLVSFFIFEFSFLFSTQIISKQETFFFLEDLFSELISQRKLDQVDFVSISSRGSRYRIAEKLKVDLMPILDNYVQIYSPREKMERSFKVSQVMHAFLLELKKNNLSPSIALSGSSVANQCVGPINIECNDIDVKVIFETKDKGVDVDTFFTQIDAVFLSTFKRLLQEKQSSEGNLEDFHVGFFSIRFLPVFGSDGSRVERLDRPWTLYELNKAPGYSNSIRGAEGNVVLQFFVQVIWAEDQEVPIWSSGGPDSFFVKLKAFGDKIGTTAPDIYELSSDQGDLEDIIHGVRKDIFISKDPARSIKFCIEWLRFLMKMTEGFVDPFSHNNQIFYKAYSIQKIDFIDCFRWFIRKKRSESNYFLFFLMNALFHAIEGEGVERGSYLEKLISSEISEHLRKMAPPLKGIEEQAPWIPYLANLCKSSSLSSIPTLLKLFIPHFSSKVSIKTHLGKKQMQCRFICGGKKLYVLTPLLDESDEPYLSEIRLMLKGANINLPGLNLPNEVL